MKVAFALIPEKGHINPYIGPAQALLDMGNEVLVVSPGDISEQLGLAGLSFSTALVPNVPSGRATKGEELVKLVQDRGQLADWIEELLLGGIMEQVEDLKNWYRRERIDVVVIDPLYYGAAIAASLCDIPWAAVSNSLNPVLPPEIDSELLSTVRRISERRDKIFAEFGTKFQFSGCDVISPYLTISFATEALVGKAPSCVHLVGPSFPLRNRGDQPAMRPLPNNKRIVYISFGSQIFYWPELFERMLKVAQNLDFHLVIAAGELATAPPWNSIISGCDVYRYAPQLEILPRATLFITHGGANSVMEAIAAGVPMLISPVCNDQFHQAYFLERAGIGKSFDITTMSVETLTHVVKTLLQNQGMKERMVRLSETYQTNGAIRAAELISGIGC